MQIAIYIGGYKLNLFDDEPINFVAKATELNDISKIFMDFMQTFSVPAHDVNNFVFQHYYNADLDGTFNANVRIPAYIEIGTLPFRTGKMQLDAVTVNNGKPDFYKITFYGDLKQLSDRFGDDKLIGLGQMPTSTPQVGIYNDNVMLSKFDHSYSQAVVFQNMYLPIGTTTGNVTTGSVIGGDIMYPLISSQRVWRVGTGDANDPTVEGKKMDITTVAGSIDLTELKPAIRAINIINAIENKYGITFSRDFFKRAAFQQLYLWLSNTTDILKAYGPNLTVALPSFNSDRNNTSINGTTRVVTVNNDSNDLYRIWLTVNPAGSFQNIPYKITMYVNEGTSRQEILVSGELTGQQVAEYIIPRRSTNPFTFRFEVQAAASFTFTTEFSTKRYLGGSLGIKTDNTGSGQQNALGFVKIVEQMPDIKVLDYLGGIIKMFNLIIRPTSDSSFLITTMDDYYAGGDIHNIDIDTTNVEIQRPQLNKTIEYRYNKSEAILNKQFRDSFGGSAEVGYGDLRAVYPIDSGETLKIELPFDNMLFEKITDPSATTGDTSGNTSLGAFIIGNNYNEEYKAVANKPLHFYNNGPILLNKPIKITNGIGTAANLNNVYLIGNENHMLLDQVSDTINYNAEISPWFTTTVNKSLYSNYWARYIGNIYNRKQRKYAFTAFIPTNTMLNISLDDRLNIGDNQYRINDYQLELLSGQIKLNLVRNFYDDPFVITNPGISRSYYQTNAGETYFDIIIDTPPNVAWTATKTALIGSGTGWATLSQSAGVGKTRVTVKLSFNGTATGGDTTQREMRLRFTTNGFNYDCIITQNGMQYSI